MAIKKALLKGYTGKVTINDHISLATSYNLTINTNILKSEGIAPLYDADINDVNDVNVYENLNQANIAISPLQDFQTYQLSISLELNPKMMGFLIGQLIEHFSHPLFVAFQDNLMKLIFDGCYLTSFSLTIQRQSAATATLNLVYYKSTFNFLSPDIVEQSKGIITDTELETIVGTTLLPYYNWSVGFNIADYSFINKDNLLNFTMTYNQTITPKYGCVGMKSKTNPPEPLYCFASLPAVTYQISSLITDKISNSNSSSSSHVLRETPFDLTINYNDAGYNSSISLTNCRNDNYTPSIGNKDDADYISFSGAVYGRISGSSSMINNE